MFAQARKRVSRAAKCPLTNQSLHCIGSQSHVAGQTPNRRAEEQQFRVASAEAVSPTC